MKQFADMKFFSNSPASSTIVAASGTGANTPIVAIDGKIEQAMDLVKTHLMFAVREEVDVLRQKIIELEATILQLEAENAILREHVPVEILNKLSLQATSSSSSTTTAAI
uniref:TSC22 domain family protein 1 n=1 Tax=Elaeophora elaphi TaxID=1147741 RepID=A0A0R3S7A0_9BILA